MGIIPLFSLKAGGEKFPNLTVGKIPHILRDMSTLLSDIEVFLRKHHMAPTRFGEDALSDRRFVKQLREGRRVWPETEAKARAFMDDYSKDDAAPKQGIAA